MDPLAYLSWSIFILLAKLRSKHVFWNRSWFQNAKHQFDLHFKGYCQCKQHVASPTCSVCKPLYWNLAKENPRGCSGKLSHVLPHLLESLLLYFCLPSSNIDKTALLLLFIGNRVFSQIIYPNQFSPFTPSSSLPPPPPQIYPSPPLCFLFRKEQASKR
jgi:hypothetical protein